MHTERYIPALGRARLTALYDPLVRLTMPERTFKERLVQQADIRPDYRVLDLGCGTGTLTLMMKQLQPTAEVRGLDGDAAVLNRAREKARAQGMAMQFDLGLSTALPYPASSFERVVSSLLFHHLTRDFKKHTLGEIHRVLKPGGELYIADWGLPQNVLMRIAFLAIQALDGFETTSDNVQGLLPDLMTAAGFEDVRRINRFATIWGTLELLGGRKLEEAVMVDPTG